MTYLKEFIVGSSYFVLLPFFYTVQNSQTKKTYSYYHYTLVAPIWLGVWNIISFIIAAHFGLSKRIRFLLVSILSSLSIMLISYNFGVYDFSREEWIKKFFFIF